MSRSSKRLDCAGGRATCRCGFSVPCRGGVTHLCRLPADAALDHTPAPLGPGGHLKAMLSGWPFRITATPTCPCNAHARRMDEWGPDECLRRLDEIVGWLRAEAEGRKMPFSDAAARLLVRRAIWKARKSL